MNEEKLFTVKDFNKQRKDLCDFVNKISNEKKDCIIVAPVKSGKRGMVEFQSLLDQGGNIRKIQHFYVTSLSRVDIKNQLEELKIYDIESIILQNDKDVEKCFKNIEEHCLQKPCVIHWDESDYGTGETKIGPQLIGKLHQKIQELRKNSFHPIKFQYYSATNEEVLLSQSAKNCVLHEFDPPETYRGAAWFLDNDLVNESEVFFDFDQEDINNILTIQSKKILNNFIKNKSKQFIGVVRITGKLHKEFQKNIDKVKHIFVQNKIIFDEVNESNSFDWSKTPQNFGDKNFKKIIFINQTCTRSTEVCFHENIAFWHDYRQPDKNDRKSYYNTVAQASLRVAHYHETGHRIKLYTNVDVIKLAAGRIKKEDFNGRLSSRIASTIDDEKCVDRHFFLNKKSLKDFLLEKYPTYCNIKPIRCSTNNKKDICGNHVINKAFYTQTKGGENRINIFHIDKSNVNHTDSYDECVEMCEKELDDYQPYEPFYVLIVDNNLKKQIKHTTTNKSTFNN